MFYTLCRGAYPYPAYPSYPAYSPYPPYPPYMYVYSDYYNLPICHFNYYNKSKCSEKKGIKGKQPYRVKMGKWEEVYDPVEGTKTWYDTVTHKTTNKDPFH